VNHIIRRLVLMGAALLIAALPVQAAKTKRDWNQVENVKGAAKRLGEMHRRQGAEATLKFLEACYKTHMLAERYTEGLESCMAQDYMLSQMLAVIYSRVPPEKLKDIKAPTAEIIARSMRGRFQAIFQQYQFTQQQADDLRKAVDKHGMPIFVKAVFPKRNGEGAGQPQPQSKDLVPPAMPLPQVNPEGNGGPAGAPALQAPAGDTP
jgi:hypothetical protein